MMIRRLITAQPDMRDGLVALRAHMKRAVDDGADIGEAPKSVDARPNMRLLNAAELLPGNAKRAYLELDLSPAEQPLLDCLADLRNWGVERVLLTHVVRVGYGQGAGYGNEQQYVDEIAREKSAGLIVIGSRSRNMIRGLFLGSVAREVIRKNETPLLLEWIEPTAGATAARCEAVCRVSLRHLMLATDFPRHALAAEDAAVALSRRSSSRRPPRATRWRKRSRSRRASATAR